MATNLRSHGTGGTDGDGGDEDGKASTLRIDNVYNSLLSIDLGCICTKDDQGLRPVSRNENQYIEGPWLAIQQCKLTEDITCAQLLQENHQPRAFLDFFLRQNVGFQIKIRQPRGFSNHDHLTGLQTRFTPGLLTIDGHLQNRPSAHLERIRGDGSTDSRWMSSLLEFNPYKPVIGTRKHRHPNTGDHDAL